MVRQRDCNSCRFRTAYKQNRLQQLRGFCYAAQAGSMSKAAQRMLLRQPSVSLQIRSLERELGVQLFDRSGPKIALTAQGKLLYELAAPLVEGLDTLEESFAARRDVVLKGRLDIAAGESTILYILPRYVSEFTRNHPGIDLELHNVTGREGLIMLRAGEVDFAFGSMLDVPDDIEYIPLYTFHPVLIAAPDHPLAHGGKITLEDIAQYPLILPPRHLTTWQVVDSTFKQRGLKYQVKVEAGGWEVIKRYVELGLGISVVTSICLTGSERLVAVPVKEYFPQRTYGVVLRKGKFLSPQARRFIELLDPRFHERNPGGHGFSRPVVAGS
ncbi:MAG TPA: LysR family transcriptional regulator [Phycisphaerae bacterium]|nr:LysR family transcriptional regulator [Phycisphaerae bacterium]HOJ76150.1 LysR family transcriptional regulator [Phycisphaerae bacterium]HOM53459.1 LysR family transcriptional regulator [Phycisphaerae bacterium]HON68077.1 LysR family transcriptional regulator [Phycisphaerae bacterium]HPP28734.1 LysR family transcriptional regulator [Phycisphaerae bacterium]